jgi:hypothetical protein
MRQKRLGEERNPESKSEAPKARISISKIKVPGRRLKNIGTSATVYRETKTRPPVYKALLRLVS